MMGHAAKSVAAAAGPPRRRRSARHGEKLVELGMAAVAASVVVAIILVFAFLAREALPLLVTGRPLEALRGLTLPTGEDGSVL